MDWACGWDLDRNERQCVNFLIRLRQPPDAQSALLLAPNQLVAITTGFNAPPLSEGEIVEYLRWRHLLTTYLEYDGRQRPILTQLGRDVADRISFERNNPAKRYDASCRALLYWATTQRNAQLVDDFYSTRYAYFWGQRFSSDEIDRATGVLEAEQLVSTDWEVMGHRPRRWYRQWLAATGGGYEFVQTRQVLPDDPSLQNAPVSSGQQIIFNIGQVVGLNTGHGNSTINITISNEARSVALEFAKELEEALHARAVGGSLTGSPESIRGAAQAHDGGILKRIVEGVAVNLGTGGATVLGTQLLHHAQQLLSLLG